MFNFLGYPVIKVNTLQDQFSYLIEYKYTVIFGWF